MHDPSVRLHRTAAIGVPPAVAVSMVVQHQRSSRPPAPAHCLVYCDHQRAAITANGERATRSAIAKHH